MNRGTGSEEEEREKGVQEFSFITYIGAPQTLSCTVCNHSLGTCVSVLPLHVGGFSAKRKAVILS